MCLPSGEHPRDEMPFDKFAAFLSQIQPSAEHLTLIGGETLLYSRIDDVLKLLAQHSIPVTVITNATPLSEKMSLRLLSLKRLVLRCSIDAATAKTYYKIHGADVFDRVVGNVARFARLAGNRRDVELIMHFVVMRENLDEAPAFVDLSKPLNPFRVEFRPVAHVSNWKVENGSGWTFRGREQSCEAFKSKYNHVMSQVQSKCEAEDVPYEVLFL
jgi:wyosine [tRNA(Phe)-imidazoG37] synthetase (radical SAM superfamily)